MLYNYKHSFIVRRKIKLTAGSRWIWGGEDKPCQGGWVDQWDREGMAAFRIVHSQVSVISDSTLAQHAVIYVFIY